MEGYPSSQPSEEKVVSTKKPSLGQRFKSILKHGASATAGLIVGANLDKMELPSFDIPSNENNNRPVPEAVENTLSNAEKEKEIIADKLASISKNSDLQYYKDHVNDVNSDMVEKEKKEDLKGFIPRERVDVERYNKGLMIRAVEILLGGRVNVLETDKIEISVYKGVPYSIKYKKAEIGCNVYEKDLSLAELVAADPFKYGAAPIDDIVTVTVSPEVIESAFANLDSNSHR